ncbi:thiol reductant ABC exporter subunit CydD [Paenibacillus doosanensis]|uniref:thiol reductant ABC exporter subunit CydD n=1 Tax=Paenibacillus doosanensis TaxID=1229154 RepID=UPI0021804C1D|nr:thiol reductant ABC exporter subunit CydD [Paenibacillus doosanensis]MCS7462676.1 thiol reductant ABC exporter subunit CydD [Paenibacillus doosanensis]
MMKKLLDRVQGTRKLLLAGIGFSVIGGVLMILESVSLARLVHGAFLNGLGLSALAPVFAVLLGWILLRALVQTASEYVSSQMAMRIKSDLRRQLLAKLVELGPGYAKGERSGELLGTVYEGVEQLEAYLARYVPQMALSMLIPAAIFCAVAGLDWISSVVLAVTLPLLVVFMILVGLAAKSKAQRQFERLGQLGGHFMDVLRGLPTLKMFGRSRAQIEIISRISEEYRKTTMGTLRLAFLSSFVMELFATLSTAIVAVFLGLRLINGEIGFEHAFLVLLLTPEFYAPVRALGTQFHASTNGMAAASRIIGILEAETSVGSKREQPLPAGKPSGCRIEFRDVSLTYPGSSVPALSNVSFTLEPGERIAVIGPTGSGKSSLLDVLQGFAVPTGGSVRMDGADLAELPLDAWRSRLSSVNQNPKLYYGTLRDNLTLGCDGPVDEERLARALEAAGVDFIGQLPDGLDTLLGEAASLSGGQIQRVAIARALLKDAPLLLLDEPTSGLDLRHEAIVRQGLERHLRTRMSVTVAHRLETVRDADRIIVMNRGRIAEIGSPAELLAAGGMYARMMRTLERETSGRKAAPPQMEAGSDMREGPDLKREGGRTDVGEERQAPWRDRQDAWRGALSFLRPYRGRLLTAVLLGCLTIAASIGLMGTSGYLIARAALRPESVLLLWVPIVGVRFFGLSRGAFRYLERLVSHDLTFRVLHRVRVWLYESLEPAGVRLLERRRSGELLQTLVGDVEQLQHMYLRVLAPPLVALITGALGCFLLAAQEWRLGLVLLAMLALSGIGLPWLSARLGREPGRAIAGRQAMMYAQTSDLLLGMKDLLVFGRAQERLEDIMRLQSQVNGQQMRLNRAGAAVNGAMLGAAHVSMWLVLTASVYFTGMGRLEPVYIPALILMTLACFEAVVPLPAAFQQLGHTLSAASRLFRVVEENRAFAAANPPERQAPAAAAASVASAAPDMRGDQGEWEVEMRGVSFRYELGRDYAVRDVTLSLKPGRRIAVVGESGAGKSTLLQLLLGLREYAEGSIRMNGRELRELPEAFIRSQYAVVSQEVQLFKASVAANLRLGRPEATDDELREAARLALIDDTIMSLPQGYDTLIGERGGLLSGGERQRLGLARALLRRTPALLLDEPATGLDVLTEEAFMNNLQSVWKRQAVVWITHKLSGLERMDEIIVMHQGEVKERGTHEQLLRLEGYYYRLWRLEREKECLLASFQEAGTPVPLEP